MALNIVMSPPDFFAIEYSINPWMDISNQVNQKQAHAQWQLLHDTYISLGCQVSLLSPVPGLPDLVFTTDHGKWINNTFFASNFRYSERVREQDIALPWYREHGFPVRPLPSDHFMEGGDVYVKNGNIFVGYGFRTSANTAAYLSGQTMLNSIALHLIDDKFYHLDTCFFPLDEKNVFYYPPAFAEPSRQHIKQAFTNAIELTTAQVNRFVCNSVRIGNHVLCQEDTHFQEQLRELGYTPVTLSVGEFNKSGGGIHCLSQILD